MDQVLFTAFSALAVVAALLAVTRKNAVASACWLVAMFFGLAGVFVLQEAYFVATTQILVYAGAIMVLFLFVIMLLDLRSVELAAHSGPKLKFAGVVLAGVFLAAVLWALNDGRESLRGADRVGAVLRRPPVAAPVADPAGGAAPAVTTPAPETLVFEADGAAPAANRPEEGDAAEPGDRAWVATVVLDPAKPKETKRLRVTVGSDGAVALHLDASAVPVPAFAVDDRTRTGTLALPGAPEGTQLDLTVIRGGFEAAPGGGPEGSARGIGRSIFEHNLLPFEVASVLLTGAIFGAVVLTKRRLS
ncbi:MAG: NADH-quinone oxidoreductase subunit J [Planctomycetia bacterium]|nr:NADH-quinone oxidoreductase subunit J [Planctomycetia bacterium]